MRAARGGKCDRQRDSKRDALRCAKLESVRSADRTEGISTQPSWRRLAGRGGLAHGAELRGRAAEEAWLHICDAGVRRHLAEGTWQRHVNDAARDPSATVLLRRRARSSLILDQTPQPLHCCSAAAYCTARGSGSAADCCSRLVSASPKRHERLSRRLTVSFLRSAAVRSADSSPHRRRTATSPPTTTSSRPGSPSRLRHVHQRRANTHCTRTSSVGKRSPSHQC